MVLDRLASCLSSSITGSISRPVFQQLVESIFMYLLNQGLITQSPVMSPSQLRQHRRVLPGLLSYCRWETPSTRCFDDTCLCSTVVSLHPFDSPCLGECKWQASQMNVTLYHYKLCSHKKSTKCHKKWQVDRMWRVVLSRRPPHHHL